MNLPSGEICAPEISGSPKNSSRSSSGGWPVDFFAACCANAGMVSAMYANRIEQTTRRIRSCNLITPPHPQSHTKKRQEKEEIFVPPSCDFVNDFHCSIAFRKMSSSESRL